MTFDPPDTSPEAPPAVDIKELASMLGISIGTVSRAINNRSGVSAKTRQRVLAAAREHRYAPNSAARQLKARPALLMGLFFAPYYGPNREINPNALNLIEHLRRSLLAQGVDLKVLHYRNDDDLRVQAEEVDVGFFYGHFEPSAFAVAHELGLPSILYDKQSDFEDQVSVLVDSRQSCNVAVQYLAALGHERIGLMTGPASELYFHAYADAFPAALREFDLPVRSDWIFEMSEDRCNQEGACAALTPLLKSADRPTAIVFASDWLALGGRKAAREAGLSIPGDLSIIGRDNLPITAEIEPPLTTFDIHLGRVSQTISHLAIQLGSRRRPPSGPAANRTVLLLSDLIKRGSCRSLRQIPSTRPA